MAVSLGTALIEGLRACSGYQYVTNHPEMVTYNKYFILLTNLKVTGLTEQFSLRTMMHCINFVLVTVN